MTQQATDHPAAEPYVQFDRVEKSFRTKSGTVTALDELSLTVNEGEFLAIVGPSGCGKSTLLLALAGLTTPTSGTVTLEGSTIAGPVTKAGVVFQNAELLPWRNALENVLLQAEVRKLPRGSLSDRARQLLADVGLGGFEDHYPDELSGGMQQRVSLCRALLHDPSILLMDEPFGALDAITRDQVQMDLQNLWLQSRRTVMFITHSIEEAVFLADRVIVLSPRPAAIAADIRVSMPRPRHVADRGSPEFTAYVNGIRDEFGKLGIFSDRDVEGR
ncbi:ABC transporter ATP-binding protein [Janibacter cremeus]|uniref:NitT/TauT family transport system ATP-binding protein n=1 Tax=Janibacter cremeus TaxID=1285192 RepID=A0A852VLZ7_9MICO|nr:ABC transporter ATP-binding protein [Janibacter cremeus]NYF98052.1 NitT/TauT family transport system ATP-binding protein [Janibacter cremeus]